MTTLIQFSYNDDFYEVRIRGSTIIQITKFVGGTQFRRELSYEDCSDAVKEKIIERMSFDE